MFSYIRTRFEAAVRRAASMPLPVGDGVLLARTAFGQFIYLQADDVSLTPSIAFTGHWEHDNTAALRGLLRPGMRFADVGANCGWFSLLAAKLVGPGGSVTAIDANPRMTELLSRSCAANMLVQRMRCVWAAVLDRDGEVELGLPEHYAGSTSIHYREDDSHHRVRVWKAPARRLADCLAQPALDVLKIDAEGSEPLIWDGARSVLRANPRIDVMMEFSPPMIAGTRPPLEFLEQIRAEGFRVFSVGRAGVLAPARDAALLAAPLTEIVLRRP